MFIIAICPPLFFYIMNPKIKSIEDANNGIYNPDTWNNEIPMSDADKTRYRVAQVYLGFVTIFGTYCLFI